METVVIGRDELEEFRRLQLKRPWDWPAVFSANRRGKIGPT